MSLSNRHLIGVIFIAAPTCFGPTSLVLHIDSLVGESAKKVKKSFEKCNKIGAATQSAEIDGIINQYFSSQTLRQACNVF